MDDYFEKNGFQLLYPERLSLIELIVYLQNAEVIAAESGTVAHNFLFAQESKKCIIIEWQAVVNEIQANIDIIKNQNITYIDGQLTVYPVFDYSGRSAHALKRVQRTGIAV